MEKIKEYAFSTILDTSYEDAISKVTDALKEEGLGVLAEIDVFLTQCPLWKLLKARNWEILPKKFRKS